MKLDLKNEPGIYCIENIVNGKKYIGQSLKIRTRKNSHYTSLRRGNNSCCNLQKAYDKYGEEYMIFTVLEYCSTEEINEKEKYYINKFNSIKQGYNILEGGTPGTSFSKEQLKLRGEAIKKTFAKKGRENRHGIKKVYQYTTNGDFVREWPSIALASTGTGIPYNTLRRCLKKKELQKFKDTMWYFDFLGNKIEPYKRRNVGMKGRTGKNSPYSKKIGQYDLDNNLIGIFDSTKEAGKALGKNPVTLQQCAKGRLKTAHGYKWKYE